MGGLRIHDTLRLDPAAGSRAGGVMGFSLCGLALLTLYMLLCVFATYFNIHKRAQAVELMDCIAGKTPAT